ncbi:MAG: phosphoglycerate dehydrogenase [Actinophytocola sp.]|nr:phosphoglycerate dehydrogenase [Actinophytocola sp.]
MVSIDIAVVEDVWAEPFDELASRRVVAFEPDAWRNDARLRELAASARTLVVRNRTQVTRDVLATGVAAVARAGVGLDNIDLAAAAELGVSVIVPTGVNAASVAEHALGLALAVARDVVAGDGGVRAGRWDRTPGRELSGGTWGLLSAGATARATARLARAIGMRVVAYDPYVDPAHPELRELGVRLRPLTEVVAAADVLSVHLPATPETEGLVSRELLAHAKQGQILVNVGRGEVLDEDAVAEAIESGRLAGAGLDMRRTEPPTPGRIDALPGVVLTPHVAGITRQSQARIAGILCAELDVLLNGGTSAYAVTPREASA